MWQRCRTLRDVSAYHWEVNPEGYLRWVHSGKPVYQEINAWGYPVTKIGRKTISFHRIQLETFKPQPHPKLECDHRNACKLDFSLPNLRWVTHALNVSFCNNHKGYTQPSPGVYRARFRDKRYGWFRTVLAAREEYFYQKSCWQREERERIISMLSLSRKQAIAALNWDERDDVYFFVDF